MIAEMKYFQNDHPKWTCKVDQEGTSFWFTIQAAGFDLTVFGRSKRDVLEKLEDLSAAIWTAFLEAATANEITKEISKEMEKKNESNL